MNICYDASALAAGLVNKKVETRILNKFFSYKTNNFQAIGNQQQ